MSYIAPIHHPTSIRHAVRAELVPGEEHLVLAKANRLEVWQLQNDGLLCIQTKVIFGAITMLQRLRPTTEDRDLIFIGTDRFVYFTLEWVDEQKGFAQRGQVMNDIAEPYMRQSQSQNKCLIDPTASWMIMHLWEGILNVYRMPTQKNKPKWLEPKEQVRLTEMWMKSSTFLHSRDRHPLLAFLYKSQLDHEEAQLAIYRLTKDEKGNEISEFKPERKERLQHWVLSDPYASILIPVPIHEEKRYHKRHAENEPAQLGGLLVIGETLVTYFDSLNWTKVHNQLQEPRIYVAWERVDNTHYLLADDFGRLDLLTIDTLAEQGRTVVTSFTVEPMTFADGSVYTSRASSLTLLGHNVLFLASHHGDTQVLTLDFERRSVILAQTMDNNAPIMDFTIMDMGNREGEQQAGNAFSSGQARIVAGCGVWKDGSLRSIRSGVGMEDSGILDELKGTRGLFPLRSAGSSATDYLAISFIGDTRLLRFDAEGGIEEVEAFAGLSLESETLLAVNLPSNRLLQITPSAVAIQDTESGMRDCSWSAPVGRTITTASANDRWILVSLDGRTVVSLDANNGLSSREFDVQQNDQISCLHVAKEPQDLGIVGRWESGDISIIQPSNLQQIHTESLKRSEYSASVPRGLAMSQLHSPELGGPSLLVALADGNVVTFDVTIGPGVFTLSGRKTVTLGNSPARLHILPKADGTNSVFATTEHASLIYSADGRLIYSATTAEDATFVAPFDSTAFPDTVVMSTDEHIKLSRLDNERLTHVKTLPMETTVRRLAYSPTLKAFGLGCIKRELVDKEEVVTSQIKLVDEIIFKELGRPLVLESNGSLEMVGCIIRAQLPDSTGEPVERFVVGTHFADDDPASTDGRDINGRILVLGVDQDRQLYEIVSHNLRGGCRCLGTVGDKIVAGLSKTVVVYDYIETTTVSGSLTKLATYRPSSFPIELDVSGTMIGVIDLMQSLALVEFIPANEDKPAKLEERARHYEASSATAVAHLDGERWLEADARGNLTVLERNVEAEIEQDQRRLQVTSEFNLGEQINRIRRLYVPKTEHAVVVPKALLGSVEGSLYLYGDIEPQYRNQLLQLQERLPNHVTPPGETDFTSWRAFRSEVRTAEKPERFIDGELLEEFLFLSEEVQAALCEGLGPSVEDMRNVVEELRRMH